VRFNVTIYNCNKEICKEGITF